MPVVGAVMRDPSLTLPERHLGLVQAGEHADIDAHIDRLADVMERSIDIDRVLDLMTPLQPVGGDFGAALPPPGQRIALAQDAAFSFLYPHVARHWRNAGAEIVPFSPLADEAPDESCDVCWLPGGYPELHAGRLAAAGNFRAGMRKFARDKPVHGECGGFMVLGQGAGRRGRHGARDARPARPRDQLCQAQDEPRLPPGAAQADSRARPGGHRRARPRVPLRAD